MHISLETSEQYAIQAYSESGVQIDSVSYHDNLIVSRYGIRTNWPVPTIQQLDNESLMLLLNYKPKIIIIGHNLTGQFAPRPVLQQLSSQHISLESMSIGAACRTYTILLGEQREVVLGLLFKPI